MKYKFILLLFLALLAPTLVLAQSENHAAIVVDFGEGHTATYCVAFSEPSISGYDLLVRSGLALQANVTGAGASVCQIETTGCSLDDCFCACESGHCVYWSYWHQLDGIWSYSQVGATAYPVQNGAVEGWVWGIGNTKEAHEPPAATFADICAAPATETAPVQSLGATAVAPALATPSSTSVPPPTSTSKAYLWLMALLVLAGFVTWILRRPSVKPPTS